MGATRLQARAVYDEEMYLATEEGLSGGGGGVGANAAEARYRSLYEARMNPFAQVHRLTFTLTSMTRGGVFCATLRR